MERDDIIKALECCTKDGCTSCPHFKKVPCQKPLMQNALSLIKELTEENERLNQIITQLGKNNDEIARVYPLAIKEAKADTVRKMHEKIEAF